MKTRGYILLFAIVFFGVFITVAIAFLGSITAFAQGGRIEVAEAQAQALAEAGFDKAVFQLNQNGAYAGESNTALGSGSFTVTVATVDAATKRVTSTGTVAGRTATLRANVSIDTATVSFNFGVQVGAGGVQFNNNARVLGNLYSNGAITGANGAEITGSATAAGTNSISGLSVGGSARARTLSNCSVGADATYQTITSCPVGGTSTATTSYAATLPFPISTEQLDEWRTEAADGGITSGNVVINGAQSLGPRKIEGTLTINGTLTLTGPLWVTGSVSLGNGATITLSSSLGNAGTVLISDSSVTLSNNAGFSGNGQAGSYPMIISMSTGTAISLNNGADSVILYAPNGTISISNNASANQITAYRLTLSNNATVSYVSGLQSAAFTSGPGGSWVFSPGTYTFTP